MEYQSLRFLGDLIMEYIVTAGFQRLIQRTTYTLPEEELENHLPLETHHACLKHQQLENRFSIKI